MRGLKVGDRVRAYDNNDIYVGTVFTVLVKGQIQIMVALDTNPARVVYFTFHRKQLRRLKPREKSVMMTREMLAKAWDDATSESKIFNKHNTSRFFENLLRIIGLKEKK